MRRLFAVMSLSVFAALGCDETTTTGPTTSGYVAVGDNYFAPEVVHPDVNGLVTWVWGGTANHDLVFNPGQGGQLAPPVSSGVYMRNFSAEPDGIYPYRCTLHSGMTGQVVKP
jgi:plastocyanin